MSIELEVDREEIVQLHDGSYIRPKFVVTREYNLTSNLCDKIVYMQINKVATRSIFKAIEKTEIVVPDHAYAGPIFYSDIADIKVRFLFAFVRNPYDRVVSAWKYAVMKNEFDGSLDNFLSNIKDHQFTGMTWLTTLPQWCFISKNGNSIDIKNLYRFETIEHDWLELSDILEKKFNIKTKKNLVNINKSRNGSERDYRNFYSSQEVRKKVEQIYEKSFNLLEYEY